MRHSSNPYECNSKSGVPSPTFVESHLQGVTAGYLAITAQIEEPLLVVEVKWTVWTASIVYIMRSGSLFIRLSSSLINTVLLSALAACLHICPSATARAALVRAKACRGLRPLLNSH